MPQQSRRRFLKSATALGIAGAAQTVAAANHAGAQDASAANDRSYWVDSLEKVTLPVVENLSKRQLRKNMPVEAANPTDRAK